MMKVVVIGGFLGSGKTTALLQFASALVAQSEPGKELSVMIIENEIGEVGVDDKLLKPRGFQVKELFAGCACCSSGGDLVLDILEIQKNSAPDWIIIEATGVAYPKAIRERVESSCKLPVKLITLADASRWLRIVNAMPSMAEAQLDGADLILVNKCDIAGREAAEAAVKSVRGINQTAPLYMVSASEAIDFSVWKGII